MLFWLFDLPASAGAAIGTVFAGIVTFLCLKFGRRLLPKDGGRKHAFEGALSAGKERGAGLIFILVFALCALLFLPLSLEMGIYLLLIVAAMLSGYLDDAAAVPWGEYKKGLIDLVISIATVGTYLNFNGSAINLPFLSQPLTVPVWLFVILGTILCWGSINVTNCSDGVDGLCGTLSMIVIFSLSLVGNAAEGWFHDLSILLVACTAGYLWFNAPPSSMMMGDAGSRALGLFIALSAMKTGDPLLFIPMAIVLILDGGLGLLKISLKRFLKISILKNTRTPLHDHVRKNKGWQNPQVVFRFAMIQGLICYLTVQLVR